VTKYLFIDGGFLDAMIPKTSKYFGIELPSSPKFNYRAISGGFQRTFYYDALPSKKDGETDDAFNAKLAMKLMRSNRWEFIVADFEARWRKRIYFDPA